MAVVVNQETICTLLDSLGVRYMKIDGSAVVLGIHSGTPHHMRGVPAEVRVGASWVTVRAFLQMAIPQEQLDAVALLLCELNAHTRVVRYALVDGSVVLQLDLPVARLALQTLAESLYAVSLGAQTSGVAINALASCPATARRYAAAVTRRTGVSAVDDGGALLEELDLRPVPIDRFMHHREAASHEPDEQPAGTG